MPTWQRRPFADRLFISPLPLCGEEAGGPRPLRPRAARLDLFLGFRDTAGMCQSNLGFPHPVKAWASPAARPPLKPEKQPDRAEKRRKERNQSAERKGGAWLPPYD